MIKKLQQLKSKKGFTLVELIVVIAIIGVLAAILVPTMMGFVKSANVTSANSTASSLETQIENILTEFDTAGYGMKLSNTSTAVLDIKITNADSKWKLTLDGANNFKSKSGMVWSTTGADGSVQTKAEATVTATQNKIDANGPLQLMGISLRALFPEIKSGYIQAYIKAGNVEYLYYTADQESAVTSMGAKYTAGVLESTGKNINFATKVCEWDGQTEGVASEGVVVGTSPALKLGKVTSSTSSTTA